jgi:GntR family transcriptional regulator, transcriptional repressor for pyruvate dehydrogenase complex
MRTAISPEPIGPAAGGGGLAPERGTTRIRRRNLSDFVADEILGLLRSGQYRPGDRLPNERELMTMFGVGRNTVREAVRSLAVLGLLDVRPGAGTTVLAQNSQSVVDAALLGQLVNTHTIDDLYEFRILLEVDAAAKACHRATAEDKRAIEAALRRYEEAVESGVLIYMHDVDFHRTVTAAAHNEVYLTVLERSTDLLTSVRQATDLVPGAVQQARRQHAEIAQAIIDGNELAARDAMTQHLRSAVETIGYLRQQALASGAQ